MILDNFHRSFVSIFNRLILETPDDAWWTSFAFWVIRIITFSLLLRTYIGPWVLALLSRHIRVRSISLRSIRGLYIRMGARTCRVERISYLWSSVDGSRRLSVKIDNLNLEVGRDDLKTSASVSQAHARALTLADFAPSPMAHRLWMLVSSLYSLVEPFFRPLLRTLVVACLRLIIRWLPDITQALTFDLHSTVVNFTDIPGTKIVVETIHLHSALGFTQLEKEIYCEDEKEPKPRIFTTKSYSMAAWKGRLTDSFRRSWDRAWGQTQGTATVSLTFNNVTGSTHSFGPSIAGRQSVKFLGLPGAIDVSVSLCFNPKKGTVRTHSLETMLSVGECHLIVDVLHSLLDSLKEANQSAHALLAVNYVQSSTSTSPTPSFTDSPPLSSFLSPNTPNTSFLSPISPSSPFLEALSASMRPRRHYRQPVSKLKDTKTTALLSFLASANIRISTLRLTAQAIHDGGISSVTYEAISRDVILDIRLSSPTQNSLHCQWLGRSPKIDNLESDAYAFRFSMHKMTLNRNPTRDPLRLLTLGPIEVQSLVSQWPSPWLLASPFMCGDANAPLLVVRIYIDAVEVTERVEILQQLMARITPSDQLAVGSPLSPSSLITVPRMALELQCGTICGRFISCGSDGKGEPLAVEIRTSGFVGSAISHFFPGSTSVRRNAICLASDLFPLRMDFKASVILQPTFIRIRSNLSTNNQDHFSSVNVPATDFLDDPALLSMETLQIIGEGSILADIEDDSKNAASIDMSSMILDLHCSTDALCIELWHPNVIAAALKLMSVVTTNPGTSTTTNSPRPPLLDRLPSGLSATIALARFVTFVTAPDINPKDDMDMSLGFALRTGISVQYCSMHSSHAHRFRDLAKRSQTRHKLYLPEERIVEAVAAARASAITHSASAVLRVAISDLALRSAVATQYVADDPHIAERDDPMLNSREFLRVGSIRGDFSLSGKRGSATSHIGDRCEVSVQIPYIRATFQLAHIYSVLLACRTLHALSPVRPRPSVQHSSSRLSYRFNGTIKTIQVFWTLPQQRLVSRMDAITAHWSPDGAKGVRWNRILVWVLLPPRINRWEESQGEKWEELVCLQQWDVFLPPPSGIPRCISVEGDNARVRIPFGYVLADLILDLSVTFKAFRHLARVAAAGHYTVIPTPEAEPAKSMPHLTVRIGCLCLEVSDDALESKLGIIWRAGFEAAKQRLDREEAFLVKVATIIAVDSPGVASLPLGHESEYHFSSKHSVSIEEARQRLDEVHALDWTLRLNLLKEKRCKSEEASLRRLRGMFAMKGVGAIPNLVPVAPAVQVPPLFRAMLNDLSLTATPPSFSPDRLPEFLHEQGNGLPRDTQFSLLLPMHIKCTLSSLRVTLRDYPLPLINIAPHADENTAAGEFDTDLVIAEEMGTGLSLDWIDCPVVELHNRIYGAAPLSISVPKTIMPVKSYANPVVRVLTSNVTTFSWGVSYGPATQDLMRIVETLSSSPRDSSPGIGFWDKMRLVFHWSVRASFRGEVRLHMKGSRDPYNTLGNGAGFVFTWHGNPKLLIARKNDDGELIQVISESMFIAIPNLDPISPQSSTSAKYRVFRKICAKFRSGVRFGVGFVPERSCDLECATCSGTPFHRKCRIFNFRSHYQVKLEKKASVPNMKGPEDSYNGFRSDFIHLSLSLASSTHSPKPGTHHNSSSLHLTPKTFAHFWSWWALFDSILSLPVRQGTYYPPRLISPKLGRHLATLKYRILVPRIFVLHAYIDDSRETWSDGVTPFVGVKAMIEEFQVDMHQRDQETIVPGLTPGTTRILRRKPFYAAEVVLKDIDLRTVLATIVEPLKQSVPVTSPPLHSNYRSRNDLPIMDSSSTWNDSDDFVETDWSSSTVPTVHFLPVMACPRFTYFKRNSSALGNGTSKFGAEGSHRCLLGEEPSVPQVQISLALARVAELKDTCDNHGNLAGECTKDDNTQHDIAAWKKKIALLEDYIVLLRRTEHASDHTSSNNTRSYHIPSDTVSPDEWAEFDNVYQVHCPKIFMNSAIRDIMMQYYYCSLSRRGFEYHMATRAVKFIRDQAEAALATNAQINTEKSGMPTSTAQAAAMALRKIFTGDNQKSSVEVSGKISSQPPSVVDPLNGWDDGVSLRKSHCCLLLKLQIVLQSEGAVEPGCVVTAVQAKLQSFAIMDDSNVDDPVSGKVMSRSYTSLSGLQTFSPTANPPSSGDGCVPLEVLIDFRCESSNFDRLVPQTDATFHYDKFNRLRLRNSVTSVARITPEKSALVSHNHLHDQTDLVQIHIPRFTVAASDQHFQAISNIVTELLLFSDAAHKTRLEKLETLLFTYDFTDLASAATVVADLQGRLRSAMETERTAELNLRLVGEEGKLELLKLKAHIILLAEELNFLFDAIKLAQDRFDDQTDRKSALLLHTSSSEISWRMLDDQRDLLAKLVVQDIDYYWLSRQDSSTVNNLAVGNLQAFDGSRNAAWPEILSKYDEPTNHPLLKRGLFILADWIVLAPVGGITIYEAFQLSFHPMRLQIDARVGRRIMEYLWPARRNRRQQIDEAKCQVPEAAKEGASPTSMIPIPSRSSLDSTRALHPLRKLPDGSGFRRSPPLRRLSSSRSFTDLSSASQTLHTPKLQKTRSSEGLRQSSISPELDGRWLKTWSEIAGRALVLERKVGDAAEMKTRSSQKTFVLVRISSLNLLLSIMKEESFVCRDARIRTRDLEYRNQTWSFEELVDQFIPSDMSWKGWIKVAFQQPLVPVIPVAREIISKTKWIALSKGGSSHLDSQGPPTQLQRAKTIQNDPGATQSPSRNIRTPSPRRSWRKVSRRRPETPTSFTPGPPTAEPELLVNGDSSRPSSRKRVLSLFSRASSQSRKSTEYETSSSSLSLSSHSLRRSEEKATSSRYSSEQPEK